MTPELAVRSSLRPLAVLAALTAALAGVVPSAAPATAAADEPLSGPCIVGDPTSPVCSFEYGTVVFVADGDTLDVKIDTSGLAEDLGLTARVRLAGVQAMELDTYSRDPAKRTGPCHGKEAVAALERMTPIGSRVRLAAQDLSARSSRDRFRRSVAYPLADGSWQDVGTRQIQDGHALWLPNKTEYAWNASYNLWSQQAGRAGSQLWDTDYCGYGPNQYSKLQVYVRSDAEGVEGVDLNGEYVVIRNRNKRTSVDLSGWSVRDTMLRYPTYTAAVKPPPGFTFPAGTVVRPGQTVTLYVGAGTPGGGKFYWNQTAPVFENQSAAPTSVGEGAYLFDPQGDLRFWSIYGCLTPEFCADPLAGKVAISAVQHDAPGDDATNPNGEFVDVTVPVGGTAVDLQGYQLVSAPYAYDFGAGSVVRPGETLRVQIGTGTATRLARFWGKSSGILSGSGDTVSLQNFRGSVLDCKAWGTATC